MGKKNIIKRTLYKLIFVIILIAILLFIYGNYGMGWEGLNKFKNSVKEGIEDLVKNTKKDEENQLKENEEEIIKVKLNMVFIDNFCYIGTHKCKDFHELKTAIINIQKENFGKDVEIIYKEKSDDNFLLAKEFRSILERSGFSFKLEKWESDGK